MIKAFIVQLFLVTINLRFLICKWKAIESVCIYIYNYPKSSVSNMGTRKTEINLLMLSGHCSSDFSQLYQSHTIKGWKISCFIRYKYFLFFLAPQYGKKLSLISISDDGMYLLTFIILCFLSWCDLSWKGL